MSAERLALCIAVGIVIGVVPILGVSTALCAAVALAFRLNIAAIQLVQALMAPLQLLLIIPFVRMGEHLVGAAPEPLSIEAGRALLSQGLGRAISGLWNAIVHASLAWVAVAPAGILLAYWLLLPLLRKAALHLDLPRPDDRDRMTS
jgi:uncharacterized protein (DUF2062 family)